MSERDYKIEVAAAVETAPLGADCSCVSRGTDGWHFDRAKQDKCEHFHLPNPHVISAYSTHRKAK